MFCTAYLDFLDLGLKDKQVFIIGIIYAFKDNGCYMSNKKLANILRCNSEYGVSKMINDLVTRGLVIVDIDKKQGNRRTLKLSSMAMIKINNSYCENQQSAIAQNDNTYSTNIQYPIAQKCNSYSKNVQDPIAKMCNTYSTNVQPYINSYINNDIENNIMDVQTSCTPSKNDNQNSNQLTVIQEQPKQSKFIKPTPEEVISYMEERGAFDPRTEGEHFFDYYTSNGWKVGKNSMKDWKASVRNWLKPKGININQPKKQEFKKYGNPYNHEESMKMIDDIISGMNFNN